MSLKRNNIFFHTGPAGGNPTGIGTAMRELQESGVPIFLKSVDEYGVLKEVSDSIDPGNELNHTLIYRMSTIGQNDGFDYDVPLYKTGDPFENDPEGGADYHLEKTLAKLPPEFNKGRVWLELINEVDKNRSEWLGRFAVHISKKANALGYKVLLFGWSSGEPEPIHWEEPAMLEFLKYCGDNKEKCGIALHEYSDTTDDIFYQYPFKIGRFMYLFATCDKHGIPRPTTAITEWGWTAYNVPAPEVAIGDIQKALDVYLQYEDIFGAAIWYLGPGFQGIANKAQKLIQPVTDFTLNNLIEINNNNKIPSLPKIGDWEQYGEQMEKHKAIVVKLPQDMTESEWLEAAAEAFQFRHTMTASHDDMLTILNGGNDESYVKFSHPERDVEAVELCEAAAYSWEPLYGGGTSPPIFIEFKYRPCQTEVITQPFGANPQNYPLTPGHEGIDYGVYAGDAFYAVQDGTVVHASNLRWSSNTESDYGWHVVLDHGDYCTVYAHSQSNLPVGVGDVVKAGDVVGYSGNTGNSDGYHLHFTLLDKSGTIDPDNNYPNWKYGRPVNPTSYLINKPAPPLPQPTIDVTRYFVPDGLYGRKIVMQVGDGTQPMQLEKRASDVILRKGDGFWIDETRYQDSEQWRVSDGQIQKGKDTSDAGNSGKDGYDLGWAQWIPQFVSVGQTYHSTPTVKRFDRTKDCQVYQTSQANDYLYIKAVIPTWVSPANSDIILNDVLVIEWRSGTSDLNTPPNEVYYFAKNIGYVGWGDHFVVEIADGQAPLTGSLDCGM